MLNTDCQTYAIMTEQVPNSLNIRVIGVEGFSSKVDYVIEFENVSSASSSSFPDLLSEALDILIAKDKQGEH